MSICSKARTLTIKHWLITHPTLVLDMDDIVYVRPAKDVVPIAGVEAWGVGGSGVGWARDGERVPPTGKAWAHSWVCGFKEWGDEYEAGFTTENPERFGRQMESLLPGVEETPVDSEVEEI